MKQKSTRHLVRFITRALVINIIGGWDIGIDHLSRVRDNLCKKKRKKEKLLRVYRIRFYRDSIMHLIENVEIPCLSKAEGIVFLFFDRTTSCDKTMSRTRLNMN